MISKLNSVEIRQFITDIAALAACERDAVPSGRIHLKRVAVSAGIDYNNRQ